MVRDLQGGELLVKGGLVSFELRGVVLGCLAAGRAALLFLPRAAAHRLEQLELAAWRRGGRRPRPLEETGAEICAGVASGGSAALAVGGTLGL